MPPIRRRARLSRSPLTVPRSCQTTTAAAKNSITESRPNPISTIEDATIPATIPAAASTVIQAMLAGWPRIDPGVKGAPDLVGWELLRVLSPPTAGLILLGRSTCSRSRLAWPATPPPAPAGHEEEPWGPRGY